jgi:hypothetical protein
MSATTSNTDPCSASSFGAGSPADATAVSTSVADNFTPEEEMVVLERTQESEKLLEGTIKANADAPERTEREAMAVLRRRVREILAIPKMPWHQREDLIRVELSSAFKRIGEFYRTPAGIPFFFRTQDRRIYDIEGRPETRFGQLATYFADFSAKVAMLSRCLDRLRAEVAYSAPVSEVYALAYNNSDLSVIAVNDFGGGMWRRTRGVTWEWRPNGHDGILFWTPADFVEPWTPQFLDDPTQDKAAFDWFLDQAHFADDILTAADQRALLRTCLLAPLLPGHCHTRPVQAHLGLADQRQHDTGKTMAGKLIGSLIAGGSFQPTPVKRSAERGEEDLQLTLMNQPFVLLDNVDTDIPWLNDFLATYATGARPTRRKHYENTTLVYYEYRGRLCVTSRKAAFNRMDVASRTIPFRFMPITPGERKTEPEILKPILAKRGVVWAGILQEIARLQDALPNLPAAPTSVRLADFEALGWLLAKIDGTEADWEAAMIRLEAAQAGFALEDEVLFPILQKLLEGGNLADQTTGEFYRAVTKVAAELGLVPPGDPARCSRSLKALKELLEQRLDIRIGMRLLNGHTHIEVRRGPTWAKA